MKKSKLVLVVVLVLINLVCFAQGAPGFEDNVPDVPAAPINEWVYVVLIAATCYGYKSIMNTAKKSNSQEV